MKNLSLMVCKGLLGSLSPHKGQALIPYLSSELQQTMESLPSPRPFDAHLLKWDLLDHIHTSWLAPYLRTLSQEEIGLILASLINEQTSCLQKALGYNQPLPPLTKIGKKSIRSTLLRTIFQNQELISIAFLPDDPLNDLTSLTSSKLLHLVRYLGLHDLAYEMRQIISTKELKKIFTSLDQKEGEFLNRLLLHREPLTFQRLFLKKWDGSKKELDNLLEERGSERLSHALYDRSDTLSWYITRLLPMHKGNLLLKYRKKSTHKHSRQILQKQIEKTLAFLTPKEAI